MPVTKSASFATTVTLHASSIGIRRAAFSSNVLLSPTPRIAAIQARFSSILTLHAFDSATRPAAFASTLILQATPTGIRQAAFSTQINLHAFTNGMPRLINPVSFSSHVQVTPFTIAPTIPRCLTCPYFDKVDGTNNPRSVTTRDAFLLQDEFLGLCRFEAPIPDRRNGIAPDATRHNSTAFDAAWTVVGDQDYCGRHPLFPLYIADRGLPPPQGT